MKFSIVFDTLDSSRLTFVCHRGTSHIDELNHRLLVCDSPPRLLWVIVDRYDGMELCRIHRGGSRSSGLLRKLFVLYLGLSNKLVRSELSIELGHNTEGLLRSSRILASPSCGLFGRTQRRLDLLLFLGLRKAPRGSSSSRNTKLTFRGIWRGASFDFDFEVAKCEILGGLRCFLRRSGRRFLLFGFPISLALGFLFGVSFLVKSVKTLATEP